MLSQLKSFISGSLTATMTEAGSNISPTQSSTSQVLVADSQPKVSESRESFQIDNLPHTPSQLPWYKRIDRRITSSYPRLHERAVKVVKYVRGPNPKIILSGPIVVPPKRSTLMMNFACRSRPLVRHQAQNSQRDFPTFP